MTLPSSGPLRFSEIRDEFNSNDPVLLSQYYRGQGLVPDSAPNANIPNTPGVAISVANFYGATNGIVVTLGLAGSPYEDLDIKAEVDAFDPTAWSSGLPIQVVIESGVVVGGTVAATPAMTIPVRTASLSITNNGDIQGAGGVDGVGGNAILTLTPVTINNQGQVYAGGGAGGLGGQGGDGRNIIPGQGPSCTPTGQAPCGQPCPPGQSPTGQNCFCAPGQCARTCCQNFPGTPPSFPRAGGSGQAGGLGGIGQGYLPQPSPTDGAAGSGPIGGNNIPGGTGGTGGNGGTWGQTGQDGTNGEPSTAGYPYEPARQNGQPGFDGGFYIVNNNLVTWTNIGNALGNISP